MERCLCGGRQRFFGPQVGASAYELILLGLIIICQAARHLDICFELRRPERTAPPEAAGRMCHYQGCQQSLCFIINNICTTARAVFVFQVAPCSGVIHCLLSSCTEINLCGCSSVHCTQSSNLHVTLSLSAKLDFVWSPSLFACLGGV